MIFIMTLLYSLLNYLQASSIDTANDFFIDYIKAQ